MNAKIKKKIKKQLQRSLASKACDFFLNGTPSCEGSFLYRYSVIKGILDKSYNQFEGE